MEQNKTEKKEIVEIRDGKVEVTPDQEKTLELTRTYLFDGEEVSSLEFSRLEEITAEDMIRASNIMADDGAAAVIPENTLYYALIIAADATGMPIEFFKKLKPKDAIKVRRLVTHYFFGED